MPAKGVIESWFPFAHGSVIVGSALLAGAGLALHALLFQIARRIAERTRTDLDDLAVDRLRGPLRALAVAGGLQLARSSWVEAGSAGAILAVVLDIALVTAVCWTLVRSAGLAEVMLVRRFSATDSGAVESRKIATQARILRNLFFALVVAVGIGLSLMAFPGVRQVGASLLASAGIAGLVVGLAAQKTIGNLIAGLQLAFTQPVRLEDVVIVEGEWGWIEEINLTYVVVKTWDLRRLVLPISYLLDRPIQNWTRSNSDILGTVTLACDHRADVQAIRERTRRIVEGTPLWDGKVCVVHLVDSRADCMEVRVLASAADSGKAWELRCHLREEVMAFLRTEHPDWLPLRHVVVEERNGVR